MKFSTYIANKKATDPEYKEISERLNKQTETMREEWKKYTRATAPYIKQDEIADWWLAKMEAQANWFIQVDVPERVKALRAKELGEIREWVESHLPTGCDFGCRAYLTVYLDELIEKPTK